MLDNIKLSTKDQTIIERLQTHPDFVVCRPKNNYYHSLKHSVYGIKLSLDFRKAVENGKVIGYGHLEINVSPHYHFNQYRHNGNDFAPIQAIKTIIDILTYLGIEQREYEDLRVVNMEFGLNIIPDTDIKNLINGILCSKRTLFVVPNPKTPYSKISDTTKYKQIKAYAKGLQFADVPEYGINQNTFRFEVKTKQFKNIATYGINTATDLLNLETYNRLGQSLLNEWGNVLQINLTPDLKGLKSDEVQFTEDAKNFGFWCEMIQPKYRNKFGRYKEKYYKILHGKNNLHAQIKGQIIDKLIYLSSGANSTQRTPTNREKDQNGNNTPMLINLEFAPPQQNNRVCLVTKLNISMQKKGSKFLSFSGLKFYYETNPKIYDELTEKYLTDEKRDTDLNTQFYYLAHNVRNAKTNPIHNRKNFEQRNYNPNQLQFNFK